MAAAATDAGADLYRPVELLAIRRALDAREREEQLRLAASCAAARCDFSTAAPPFAER